MNNISVSCGEIKTDEGFEFKLPSVLLNRIESYGGCEPSWWAKGRMIADPLNGTVSYPAISVSSDHLVTSHCENLSYDIICDTPSHYEHKINYTVDETNVTVTTNSDVLNEVNPSLDISDHLWWLIVPFIIIIIICFILRKRIFRCFQRKRSICQTDDDTDNRDKDPYSRQESETVQCADDDHI